VLVLTSAIAEVVSERGCGSSARVEWGEVLMLQLSSSIKAHCQFGPGCTCSRLELTGKRGRSQGGHRLGGKSEKRRQWGHHCSGCVQ
jgi:hypothetical protein